ncbi:hypothetical protein NUTIK01_10940 [Novosphingobium sp. IK01]|uniref:Uncharacterized protein n=1 Tax=Novosphingobium pituita TaxID=3056842 RepID=A0ABQ6P4Y0_9SPHN|nr:hypothetical protein NUTIK01_10940 [Novosphingobium sp. IK01]
MLDKAAGLHHRQHRPRAKPDAMGKAARGPFPGQDMGPAHQPLKPRDKPFGIDRLAGNRDMAGTGNWRNIREGHA